MDTILETIPGPVLFVGIGNRLKGDDAAGPVVIDLLKAGGTKFAVLDCGEVPENYLAAMTSAGARSIIFIDAVEMGEKPGTAKLFPAHKIALSGVFTHGISLTMLYEYLRSETDADVYLLGVQPKSFELGAALSVEVKDAIDHIVEGISHA